MIQYVILVMTNIIFIGDIGYYTEAGEIFFTRRMKDVLKVDNFWFGPGEIEALLEQQEQIQVSFGLVFEV